MAQEEHKESKEEIRQTSRLGNIVSEPKRDLCIEETMCRRITELERDNLKMRKAEATAARKRIEELEECHKRNIKLYEENEYLKQALKKKSP